MPVKKSPCHLMMVGAFFFAVPVFAVSDYSFKLSPSLYAMSNGVFSSDMNIRATHGFTNVWAGYTKEFDGSVSQYRWGADNRSKIAKDIYLLSSIQNASGGLWAGVVGLEYGRPWFINGSLGRTNLNPYWNLNFDPNDSYQIGFGRRFEEGHSISAFHVHDNRLNPNQSHTHVVFKNRLKSGDNLSLDLLYKQGLVEGEMIRRLGVAIEYDHSIYFGKIAFDPKVNFTSNNMLRFTAGFKF